MFHPTVAGRVETYSDRHFGFAMAIFGMGGTLSFGIGPLFISWFVSSFDLSATPFTMLIGLAVMIYLHKTVPLSEGKRIVH